MTRLPMNYTEDHGETSVMYDYYGLFIADIAAREYERGYYGLTMAMVEYELAIYGGRIEGNELVFDNDNDSTLFILRWSR